MALDLESELDRLYGAELGEFVALRTQLVRALKKEDRRAEAAQVQELRKPSLPAWTIDQLVRRNREDVDLLLAAGEHLTEAQDALLAGGDQQAFAEAREKQQMALKPLREAARKILGNRASDATLERVASTLRAAAVTAEGREQLAQGRLTDEIEPLGFEAFAGTRLAKSTTTKRVSPPRSKPHEKDAARRKAQQDARARARANLKAANEREAALARKLSKANQAVQEARKALDDAERKAARALADRDAATKAVELSRRELEDVRIGP